MEIDRKAFRALSSGLYVISSVGEDGRPCGCIVNTLLQVSSDPAQLLVSLNKSNATTAAIESSGRFHAAVLDQDVEMELIGTFGFKTSTDVEKFADYVHSVSDTGIPHLGQNVLATFEVKVDTTIDVNSHLVFIGTVEAAQVVTEGTPLTYEYYHRVLRGKTPAKAASYNDGDDAAADEVVVEEELATEPKVAWRCKICGYTVEGYPDGLPEDWRCPMCGMGRDCFEKVLL